MNLEQINDISLSNDFWGCSVSQLWKEARREGRRENIERRVPASNLFSIMKGLSIEKT